MRCFSALISSSRHPSISLRPVNYHRSSGHPIRPCRAVTTVVPSEENSQRWHRRKNVQCSKNLSSFTVCRNPCIRKSWRINPVIFRCGSRHGIFRKYTTGNVGDDWKQRRKKIPLILNEMALSTKAIDISGQLFPTLMGPISNRQIRQQQYRQ